MANRYDELKKFIDENVDRKPPVDKHPGVRLVPTMQDVQELNKCRHLSEETRNDLSKLMGTRPKLGYLILDIINDASEVINQSTSVGKVKLGWPWRMHELENIFIYQNTFPKMLEEPMQLLGYDRYLRLPWNFRIGLLVHLDFCAKDGGGYSHSTISVGSLWCGYEKDENILVSHKTCILLP